jgi:mono/diheme cytochrome c family protein
MTRHLIPLLCCPLLLACGSTLRAQDWVAPQAEANAANPLPDNKTSRSAGKSLYEQYCLTCHGPEGKGDGPGGQYLTPKPGDLSDAKLWDESDGSLHWKIITGRNAMPSFKYFLKENERWQVIRYLRTFAPQPKTDAATPAPTTSAVVSTKPQ